MPRWRRPGSPNLTPSANKVHNFQSVAFGDGGGVPFNAANNFLVQLNGDSFGFQPELRYEIADSGAFANVSLISVNDDCQLSP